MENKYRHFFTEKEIEELDMEELAKIAGGITIEEDDVVLMASNDIRCPRCKQKIPIRDIKTHLQNCKK